jgi:hypothetical protein
VYPLSLQVDPDRRSHCMGGGSPAKRVGAVGDVAWSTGVERALATCTIPIEGRDEWVAAARRLA